MDSILDALGSPTAVVGFGATTLVLLGATYYLASSSPSGWSGGSSGSGGGGKASAVGGGSASNGAARMEEVEELDGAVSFRASPLAGCSRDRAFADRGSVFVSGRCLLWAHDQSSLGGLGIGMGGGAAWPAAIFVESEVESSCGASRQAGPSPYPSRFAGGVAPWGSGGPRVSAGGIVSSIAGGRVFCGQFGTGFGLCSPWPVPRSSPELSKLGGEPSDPDGTVDAGGFRAASLVGSPSRAPLAARGSLMIGW